MKILICTDIHGSHSALAELKKKAKSADMMIIAGDLSIFEHEPPSIVHKMAELKLPTLVIHGNHESPGTLKHLCEKYDNMKFIHGKTLSVGKIMFLGYGGGGFSYDDPKFTKLGRDFKKKIKPGSRVILVLHGPPYRTKLDNIWGEHAGNKSYRSFIEKVKPMLVICDHLHENQGVEDHIGQSRIINPGPKGKIMTV